MNKEDGGFLRLNEQITVPKHTWKVNANATPMVQMIEKNIKIK